MDESNAICCFLLSALVHWRIVRLPSGDYGRWSRMAWLSGRFSRHAPGRLMDCFCGLSLWVSLPLAIWLSSGWIGLLLHWHALPGAACLLERAAQIMQPAIPAGLAGKETSEGDASCAVVSSEAH
jgi:hypothetical protein